MARVAGTFRRVVDYLQTLSTLVRKLSFWNEHWNIFEGTPRRDWCNSSPWTRLLSRRVQAWQTLLKRANSLLVEPKEESIRNKRQYRWLDDVAKGQKVKIKLTQSAAEIFCGEIKDDVDIERRAAARAISSPSRAARRTDSNKTSLILSRVKFSDDCNSGFEKFFDFFRIGAWLCRRPRRIWL